MDTLVNMMEKGVDDNVFPGAVLLVAKNSKILFHKAFGRSDIYSNQRMTKETIFDLASLTKPLATAMAVLKLIDNGVLDLDQTIGNMFDSLSDSLSDFTSESIRNKLNNGKEKITINELLRHTSGFPGYRPYYQQLVKYPQILRRAFLRDLVIREPLVHKPGEKELYSDLGYILLAWIVEIFSSQRLDYFLREQVYRPLGIDALFFVDLHEHASCIDTSGVPDNHTAGKYFAATENCPWRKKLIKAEVHDDNAWAAGGIEGHAGLFGTAYAVFVLLTEVMSGLKGEKTKVISGRLLREFVIKHGRGDRVAGFDTPSRPVSSSGRYFSASSVGHLGFTGTSFWIDPEKSVVVVLLTNRVHPSRNNEKIKEFRPLVHNCVMEGM